MGWRPGVAPTDYLNEKHVDKNCQVRVDPRRGPVIKQIFEKVANEQWSGRKIYSWLRNDLNFTTRNNKYLSLSNIYIMLRNPYYYGEFEYPVGSNNWYQGKYIPLITRELFDKVQVIPDNNFIPKTENKEFAFTKLIKCGCCGSGISADEKFKKLKDGGVNRHVYSFCTKAKNIECNNKAINETDLINELIELKDRVDLDELGIKEKIREEIVRINKFNTEVLGKSKEKTDIEIDIRNYVKYLLKQGTILEKRELLPYLKSKLILRDKKILLENKP